MADLQFSSVLDLRYGLDPARDAWLLHFMAENNLEYNIDPRENATPEQLRFMVSLPEDGFYVPCSDETFRLLTLSPMPRELEKEYLKKWKVVERLVRGFVPDAYLRKSILNLCRHRFRLYMSSHMVIPSRMMKRLNTIFLALSGQDDPYRERKVRLNRLARDMIASGVFEEPVDSCPLNALECRRIADLRHDLDLLELERLIRLSTWPDVWREPNIPDPARMTRELASSSLGVEALATVFTRRAGPKKILYLPNVSGGLLFDLQVVRSLLRMGHTVILALKEGFYFNAPTLWDGDYDPVLKDALHGAHFLPDVKMSKNALLAALRGYRFVVISDGTRERLNLYRTSVTFARAWKEADLILTKGMANHRRLIMTGHHFTRDILNFHRDERGGFHASFKPRPKGIYVFREADLLGKAEEIIEGMRRARAEGRTVMFYSGIIGSLPGQTKTAIEVMNTFITYLRQRLEGTYIINPGEHFEEGMDADDLMFMWEKVQRSGLIDVWRFQAVEDIERSFELMLKKIPPAWTGKDSTYSTGCTKEMHIALDMQKRHPELQIMGPEPEKFFRRREYGIGKFSDVAIA